MSSLDILFWLLVALMGGVGWAVESGLGGRHRRVLASSVLAALGSSLFIMFWVDDATKLELERVKPAANKDGGDAERGGLQSGGGGKKKGGGGSDSASGAAAAAGATTPPKDDEKTAQEQLVETEEDGSSIVYSRVPFKDCPICPDLIIVPKGIAQVGSPANEPGRAPDERVGQMSPVPMPFAIGRLEISRKEYAAFANEINYVSTTQCDLGKRRGRFDWLKPGFEQDDRHPAVCLSWHDVRIYLAWISEKTGRKYRLPTEVEWEHAARAETTTPYWNGDSLTRHHANFGRSRDGTTVGGLFAMNRFGLVDVIGNAAEMIAECAPEPGRPAGQPTDDRPCRRYIKGGGWNSPAAATRHAARAILMDATAFNHIGFRVARNVDPRDDDKILTAEQKKALVKADQEAAAIAAEERAAEERAAQEAAAKRETEIKAAEAKAAEEKAKAAAQPKK